MLRTLREPPHTGSLREWVLILYLLKEDEIEQARELANAYLTIAKADKDADKAVEVWNNYRDIARPYIKVAQKKEKNEAVEKLMAEVRRGPLQVTPLPTGRSRLHGEKTAPPPSKQATEVYSRLNPIIRIPK